ncbi:hypothetical protein [Hyphomonas sp.]|nr:hypothetical protein [Hyphomonas sp.]
MNTPPEAPPPPAAVERPASVPASTPTAEAPPNSFLARTFSLSVGQALRLLGISTLVGFFVLAFDFAPTGTTFDLGGAFTAIIHRAFTAIGWAFDSFWKPALAGAVVVLPLWALWRLVQMPFRK